MRKCASLLVPPGGDELWRLLDHADAADEEIERLNMARYQTTKPEDKLLGVFDEILEVLISVSLDFSTALRGAKEGIRVNGNQKPITVMQVLEYLRTMATDAETEAKRVEKRRKIIQKQLARAERVAGHFRVCGVCYGRCGVMHPAINWKPNFWEDCSNCNGRGFLYKRRAI